MSQFIYRLQLLLERKEEAKKEAEQELARREQEREVERKKLESLECHERELEEKRQQLRRDLLTNPSGGTLTAREVQDRSAYVKVVGVQIEEAKAEIVSQRSVIEQCEERVKEAKTQVDEARREVEVLKKHRAKQEERFLRELQAKEELALDEVGNVLYTTRRRPS